MSSTRMPSSISVVLFDVDGTLVDSNHAHATTWAQALTEHGHPHDAAQVRRFIGMGGDKLLPALAGIEEGSPRGRAISRRKRALFAELVPTLVETPGASDLVSYLRDHGIRVVVASSAADDELQVLLKQIGLDALLADRASKDDAPASKPSPDIVQAALGRAGADAADAMMIGDTPYDIEAAAAAGVASIALRCGGYWTDRDFHGASAVFDDPKQLLVQWPERRSD